MTAVTERMHHHPEQPSSSPFPGRFPGPDETAPQQPGPYGPAQAGPYASLNPHGGGGAPAPGQAPPGPGGPYGPQDPAGAYGPQGPVGPYDPAQAHPADGPAGLGQFPTAGGGRRRFGRPAVLLAAGLAALLLIGGGTWLALSGDGGGGKTSTGGTSGSSSAKDKPAKKSGPGSSDPDTAETARMNAGGKPGDAKVLWLRNNDVDVPGSGADVFGPWVVGDTIVTAMYRTVTAHSVKDGTLRWSLPLGSDICKAPEHASSGGKIVIAVQEKAGDKMDECRSLRMIDLKTGKEGWRQHIAEKGNFDFFQDYSIAISGNTVAVGRINHPVGYRLTDGKELFGEWKGENCQPYAYAAEGRRLVAAASCPAKDQDHPQEEVHGIDPDTGASLWKYRIKTGYRVDHVYSVRPLVVSVTNLKEQKHAVFALDEMGKMRSTLQSKDDFMFGCSDKVSDEGNLQTCQVVVDGNTLYAATQTGTGGKAAIAAFDLRTGKVVRRIPAPGKQVLMPLRMNLKGEKLIVRVSATDGEGGSLALVGSRGTKLAELLRFPASTAKTQQSFPEAGGTYEDGRFFLVHDVVVGANDAEEKTRKTMMAFGE
ncbi:PQQ-binding-like beta-propeller repeat protein [Streptomyces sp. NPDC019396]|uniref:outer membrane protein assembly factor BamB family protein n=1 Tax=Streptomyces sp. NPDC019396 TaxID=3154687 RepID=UPI0033EE1BD5